MKIENYPPCEPYRIKENAPKKADHAWQAPFKIGEVSFLICRNCGFGARIGANNATQYFNALEAIEDWFKRWGEPNFVETGDKNKGESQK